VTKILNIEGVSYAITGDPSAVDLTTLDPTINEAIIMANATNWQDVYGNNLDFIDY